MEPLYYVMAILGCGEGDLPCTELRVAPARYESQAACLTASESELSRQDLQYPVAVAECRRADRAAMTINAAEISIPDPEPNRAFPTQPAS